MSTPIVSRLPYPEDSASQGRCAVCGVTNKLLRCSRCKTVKYCTKEHQIIDWRNHKAFCSSKIIDDKTDGSKYNINKSVKSANSKVGENHSGLVENGIVSSNLNSNVVTEINRIKSGRPGIDQKIVKHVRDSEARVQKSSSRATTTKTKKNGKKKNTSAERPEVWTMPITYAGSSEDTILGARGQSLNPSLDSSRIVEETDAETMDIPRIDNHNNHHHHHHHHNGMNFPEVTAGSEEDYLPLFLHKNPNSREEFIIDDICRNVIRDMNKFGVCVVDSFLGHEKGISVLNEVLDMYSAGMFEDGQLVSNRTGNNDLKTIRGDQITWLDGKEKHCENIGMLISKVDSIIIRANRMPNNGKLADYAINERTKAMVACYPGRGSHYVKHVDNPNRDGRCITAIYYLNKDWDIKKNGGLLRIFPEGGRDQVADIAPLFDRILFFWSDRRNPHEVQPAYKTRYAITLWYFDAEERSEACRRYQMEREVHAGSRGQRPVIEAEL